MGTPPGAARGARNPRSPGRVLVPGGLRYSPAVILPVRPESAPRPPLAPGSLPDGADFEELENLAGDPDPLGRRPGLGSPEELPGRLSELVRGLVALGPVAVELLVDLWDRAARQARAEGPEGERLADRLARAVGWLDRPSLWRGALPEGTGRLPGDGWLAAAARAAAEDDPAERLEALGPGWIRDGGELYDGPPLPPDHPLAAPLDEADLARVDAIFERHLCELGRSHRPAQREVAAQVARSLGKGELLLLHAPTGTGKTLAYLVPALIFALRGGLRVGVATYTRALQDQAMGQDVPLALALLEAAGVRPRPRVAALKGRSAYLCWRTLCAQLPGEAASAAEWLAYARLLRFALASPTGDLDEFARRAFGGGPDGRSEALEALVGAARADLGCCAVGAERVACGAAAARRRAERAHLVVTNQALALTTADFLRHLIFDECEHLHDQAHEAFSHRFSAPQVRASLVRLVGDGGGRAPLERIAHAAGADSGAGQSANAARDAGTSALSALGRLEAAVTRFCAWRAGELPRRGENEAFALLPEYVLAGQGGDLLAATGDASRALRRLGAELALIAPELERLPVGGRARLRRQLERARVDVDAAAEALFAWLPLEEGLPAFRRETFCDVAEERGGVVLVARVLLPAQHLARALYPSLAGAVLLSAATRLGGGFGPMERYLGLDLAAAGSAPADGPGEGEERSPRAVRFALAPESFDYGRVLVACPEDLPDIRAGREAWRAHARGFVAKLAVRTRGRLLVLLTSQEDLADLAAGLGPELATRGIALLWQGMPGVAKEQLAERFRRAPEAVLLGLDTFWFGADFPGETLEYLVIAKLPYGVPDRYHQAQCAALGAKEQRRGIYMPRALARFRQGFGRLMRRADDRGCVFVLDRRLVEPRHAAFRRELPLEVERGARWLVASTEACLEEAARHMKRLEQGGTSVEAGDKT